MTDPLVPADVNLRGLPWMRLDTTRLLDSDLFALSTGDEFKAAVALWCKSWTQQPAASLPSDDRVLAHLSGAGSRWKKVKAMALRGWVLASDGRLYHPVVAEQALQAWEERQEFRAEIDGQNERKQRERAERAAMFEQLKAAGHVLAWNTPTGKLRDLLRDLSHEPVTQSSVTGVTGHGDSHGLDGTGRDGNISTPEDSSTPDGILSEPAPAAVGTPAGHAAAALSRTGLRITSQNPNLIAACAEGVTVDALLEVRAMYPDKPAGYVIQAARSIHAERATATPRAGPGQPHVTGPTSKVGQAIAVLESLKSHGNHPEQHEPDGLDLRRDPAGPAATFLPGPRSAARG